MKPTDVNHSRFILDKVHPVIYDNGEFSVVWGAWVDDQGNVCPNKGLGMRWNESPGPNGFPTSGPTFRPVWLVIPQELSVPFTASLLGKPFANPKAILNALQELEARGAIRQSP
jgi:hypothetical protein